MAIGRDVEQAGYRGYRQRSRSSSHQRWGLAQLLPALGLSPPNLAREGNPNTSPCSPNPRLFLLTSTLAIFLLGLASSLRSKKTQCFPNFARIFC